MIRCLITNGNFSRDPQQWLAHVTRWIGEGVDLLQIRERGLTARDLAALTRQVLRIPNPHGTKILINDRADVATACGAHGVHLRDGSVTPAVFSRPDFLVTVARHSVNDAAGTAGADYVLLAPIFSPLSKEDPGAALGTEAIREFTRRSLTPVLALGGITNETVPACLEAGAAGIAGISFFENRARQ